MCSIDNDEDETDLGCGFYNFCVALWCIFISLVIGVIFTVVGPTAFFCGDPITVGDYESGTCIVLNSTIDDVCGRNRALFELSITRDNGELIIPSSIGLGGDWCRGGDGNQNSFISEHPLSSSFECYFRSNPRDWPLSDSCDILEIQTFAYDNFDGSDAQLALNISFTYLGVLCVCLSICNCIAIGSKFRGNLFENCCFCIDECLEERNHRKEEERIALEKWKSRWDFVITNRHRKGWWTEIENMTPQKKRKDFVRILPQPITLYIFELMIELPDSFDNHQKKKNIKKKISFLGQMATISSAWNYFISHQDLWTKIYKQITYLPLDPTWDSKISSLNALYYRQSSQFTPFFAKTIFEKKQKLRKSSFFLDLQDPQSRELRISDLQLSDE